MTKISHDSEVAAHGQQVITACAVIHTIKDNESKILLAKRAHTKKFMPGVYELPGGHIDFGENIATGLQRELKEELNIDVSLGDPFFAFDYTNEVKGSHSAEIIYFAKLVSPESAIIVHPEDHETIVWVSKDTLPTLYTAHKGHDDIEFQAIRRAFELLEGAPVNFE